MINNKYIQLASLRRKLAREGRVKAIVIKPGRTRREQPGNWESGAKAEEVLRVIPEGLA